MKRLAVKIVLLSCVMSLFSLDLHAWLWRDNWKVCDVYTTDSKLQIGKDGATVEYSKMIWLGTGYQNGCQLAWNASCDRYGCTLGRSLDSGSVNYKGFE